MSRVPPHVNSVTVCSGSLLLLLLLLRDNAMVQLSVLLCLIPLALENAMMQAHITQVGTSHCSQSICSKASSYGS